MVFSFFKKKTASIVTEIVEKRLKRKVISYQNLARGKNFQSYNILTDKGYLALRSSSDESRIKSEKIIVGLAKKHQIPIPTVMLYEELYYGREKTFILVEEIAGEPFLGKSLNIFDFNRVLTQFAEILLSLHSIEFNKFGFLRLNSAGNGVVANYENWNKFMLNDLEIQLKYFKRAKILDVSIIEVISRVLKFESRHVSPALLHGHISSGMIFVKNHLKIASIVNLTQPLSGDPNWEMAGFLIYDGPDRAKRLVKSYFLLGGLVEWGSKDFLKTALRRAIGSLYWVLKTRQANLVRGRLETVKQLVHMNRTLN